MLKPILLGIGILLICSTSSCGSGTSTTSTTTRAASGTTTTSTPGTKDPPAVSTPRPSYNTGVGFFIGTDNKLYDANGIEFHIKGVNRNHYDSGAGPAIAKTNANAERWVLYWPNGTTVPQFVAQFTSENFNHSIVAIPGQWTSTTGHTVTCSSDPADLTLVVDDWVNQAADWKPIEKWSIINIANEWGPSNSTVWRDSYITAISRMRTAGYLGTLMIDAGGCGQDWPDVANYGQAVFDSDPQKNILFDVHLYGNLTDNSNTQGFGQGSNFVSNITQANPAVVTYTGGDTLVNGNKAIIAQVLGMTQVNSTDGNNIIFKVKNVNVGAKTFELTDLNDVNIDSTGYGAFVAGGFPSVGSYTSLAHITSLFQTIKNSGLPIVFGEFGPGRNVGPSPTMAWPGDVIRAANSLGIGWIAWAWDDHDLSGGDGCLASDFWFALSFDCQVYNSSSDLTTFGKVVIEDATDGIQNTAVSASIF